MAEGAQVKFPKNYTIYGRLGNELWRYQGVVMADNAKSAIATYKRGVRQFDTLPKGMKYKAERRNPEAKKKAAKKNPAKRKNPAAKMHKTGKWVKGPKGVKVRVRRQNGKVFVDLR